MIEVYKTFTNVILVKIFLNYESLLNDMTKDAV